MMQLVVQVEALLVLCPFLKLNNVLLHKLPRLVSLTDNTTGNMICCLVQQMTEHLSSVYTRTCPETPVSILLNMTSKYPYETQTTDSLLSFFW